MPDQHFSEQDFIVPKRKLPLLQLGLILLGIGAGGLRVYAGAYGFNVLLRHGGSYWVRVRPDSPRLSPSMRLALKSDPVAKPGALAWRAIAPGFEAGELPALVDGQPVDRIFLARIDPAKFRFAVRVSPAGDKDIDDWMHSLGAALVVNGSFYAHDGQPATPLVSAGAPLGPPAYAAQAGAFISSAKFTGVRDLFGADWHSALKDSNDALISYPLLLDAHGTRVARPSRWLASRSFIGQDTQGRLLIGTTQDGFFSLLRLAQFLRAAPLDLTLALNLDGGPVACQGISLNGFSRRIYGRWEFEQNQTTASLLTWPYGKSVGMPIVLAVFPK